MGLPSFLACYDKNKSNEITVSVELDESIKKQLREELKQDPFHTTHFSKCLLQ